MPLPEHEQRQLQQIEQALCRDDPKFGRRIRASDPRIRCERKLLRALLGAVVGAGLLAAGAVTHRVYLDAAGVVIVLLSLVWAVVSWRRRQRSSIRSIIRARQVCPDRCFVPVAVLVPALERADRTLATYRRQLTTAHTRDSSTITTPTASR